MKKLSMRITDFPYEVLQLIIILLAKSSEGAEGLARTITVCKHFLNFGDDKDVLRVTNFDHVELSDVGNGLFQCNNSLIKRCAQHGNVSAQYLLAKVILATSSKVPTDRLSNYFEATGNGIGEPDISKGKQLSTSSRSGGKLYHYELVRLFMKQCDILDFASMVHRLIVYVHCRCSSEAGCDSFFHSVRRMTLILGFFTSVGLREGQWCYDPETKLLPTEFETEVISRLRNRCILRNLSGKEVRRDCKDMAELSIVLGHGSEAGKEAVLELGERFFHHLVRKFFDENVKLLDPNVLLLNPSFKRMKELCVETAKEYEMHRSNAVKAFDIAFPPLID